MKILALDSSAVCASAAVYEEGRLLAESFLNVGLTHSETLLKLVAGVLEPPGISLDAIGLFAVSAGPGSFTGVRIGVSLVKGLAFGRNTPCASVSSLEAAARPFEGEKGIVCASMDARCGQVYNALFLADGKSLTRLTPDRALSIEELGGELEAVQGDILLVGDGAALCAQKLGRLGGRLRLMPESCRYQRALGVAMAAEAMYNQEKTVCDKELVPVYLRPSQAERELKKKEQAKGDGGR